MPQMINGASLMLALFSDYFDIVLKSYDQVYRMIEPKPPVKYPRTPGYRPPPEENKLNAWYVEC